MNKNQWTSQNPKDSDAKVVISNSGNSNIHINIQR
jgi:hypothetical protein